MRIASINNTYPRIAFKSTAGGTLSNQPDINPDETPENEPPKTSCMGCLGNILYTALLVNTIVLMPMAKKDLGERIEKHTTAENVKNNDYIDLKNKLHMKDTVSTAFYQVNKLHDVDNAEFKKTGDNQYEILFTLDESVVNMSVNVNPDNKNNISGALVIGDKNNPDKHLWVHDYTINFSEKEIGKFALQMKSRENNTEKEKIILERNYDELYIINENGRKKLNAENVAEFKKNREEYWELLELYDDTCQNQQFNILIAALLTLLKMKKSNIERRKEL